MAAAAGTLLPPPWLSLLPAPLTPLLIAERSVASYMRAVLRTLAQCHAQHILHRDIKPGALAAAAAACRRRVPPSRAAAACRRRRC